MPPVTGDLRAWPENCLSSFKSEKHKPTTSTRAQHLVGAGLEDGFGFVDLQLVRSDQLHRLLFFRNCHNSLKLRVKNQKINESSQT